MFKEEHAKVENSQTGILATPHLPTDLNKVELTDNALQVFARRYVRRDANGDPVEEVEETFWRVAYHVAKVEAEWENNVDDIARSFYELLSTRRFFPNSPTFTGAGTPLGQLAACFVLPVSDDMGRNSAGIFHVYVQKERW
jgi:ribonucleoside-diphosphate reductase alpha chain